MDLFRKEVKRKSPVIYPNLALRGNRAVKYSLSKTSSVQTKERELSIPSLPYIDKVEERKITNLVMFANKQYRLAKYRIEEGTEWLIDICKMLAVQPLARNMYRKLSYPSSFNTTSLDLVTMPYGGEHMEYRRKTFEKKDDICDYGGHYEITRAMLEEVKDQVERDEYNFLFYEHMATNMLPMISDKYVEQVFETCIDMYYRDRDFKDAFHYAVSKIALCKWDSVNIHEIAEMSVRKHTMLGFDKETIKAEVDVIHGFLYEIQRLLSNGHNICMDRKYDIIKRDWRWNRDKSKWDKIVKSNRKPRGLVRAIYNHYMLKNWYGEQGIKQYTGRDMPTEIAKQMEEAMGDGIKLPEFLDDELKNDIKQDANQRARWEYDPSYGSTDGRHGKAYVKPFTPNEKVPSAIRELHKKNSDIGVVPKNMHRMTTDKKVFSSKRVVAGGSMMIDCSGSMYWSYEDIKEIIELLPASIIAGYEGYNQIIDGKDGIIRIFADKGKLDTREISQAGRYGCNSVDLDALKWLAKQHEPRIWVSDQAVVGVNDEGRAVSLNPQLKIEIMKFMVKNNIIPIRTQEMVYKVAKQLATSVKKKR